MNKIMIFEKTQDLIKSMLEETYFEEKQKRISLLDKKLQDLIVRYIIFDYKINVDFNNEFSIYWQWKKFTSIEIIKDSMLTNYIRKLKLGRILNENVR